jgi:hypothetical protein
MTAPTQTVEPRRLCTFVRSETEELRVELSTFEGHPFVNVRLWFKTKDEKWLPTKKGCSLRLRELPELCRALGDADVQLAGGHRQAKPRRESSQEGGDRW